MPVARVRVRGQPATQTITGPRLSSAQVLCPLAACCKRLRPLMLPKLTEMRTSAILRLSMLGHY